MKLLYTLIIHLFLIIHLGAQSDTSQWNVNHPPLPYESYEFSWDEGTWMNLDVSPDGNTIVFDILGDIYTVPREGGMAKALKEGISWDIQPRFSPSGDQILYTSDAGGGDNIWVMDTKGNHAKAITEESFRLLNNGDWMPDGNYIVARKHFTSGRSLGAGEMWMYHKTGGSGIQLTKRKNDQQDVNEPTISPDGKYMYYSEDIYPGGSFQYNKDPNKTIYAIKRYSFESGKTKTLIHISGGSSRPQVSPSGKELAFVRRMGTQSVLNIFDLETGEIFPIWKRLSKDQQEAWAIFGAYPGFDWTPDGKFIIIWAQGKIWEVNVEDKTAKTIPFQVKAKKDIVPALSFQNDAFTQYFRAKVIRHAQTSPDGKTLIFSALGKLWEKDLPNGNPRVLVDMEPFLFEPNFSKDGHQLVFVSWSDTEKGAIWIMDLNGGKPVQITSHKGIYRNPSFSNDGSKIVFRKESGNIHQGYTYTLDPGIHIMNTDGTNEKLVTEDGQFPSFSKDDNFIYYQQGGYLFGSIDKSFHKIDLDGRKSEKLYEAKYAHRFVPSPDNQWIAWSELYKVYVAPLPKSGKELTLNHSMKSLPLAQVAKDAGINIHWSADSKELHWMLGETYFTDQLTDRFTFLEGSRDSLPPMDTTGISIHLDIESAQPDSRIAFTHARVITMENDQIIEDGTIIVNGNTIEQIGRSQDLTIPEEMEVIDCKGKTIMPGIIDVHGHLGDFRYGLSPQKNWYYWANLAYGVTTAHDPSSNSEMIFSHSEMIRAGEMKGPRLFSTGTILYGADGDFKAVINSKEDALSAIRRTKAYGAFSVKSYNQPRRDQRQQVISAAIKENILVMPEGGSTFNHNMNQIADGHTGIEHNIPVAPLYNDVIDFWAASGSHNTPTLIVNYGSITGEYYYYQKSNVWENEKLLNFTPKFVLDSRARHRTKIPEEEYINGHMLVAESLKKLKESGVKINLGAHGQLQGLGAHWELWMLASGGMSNHEALKAATMNGAQYLGMDHQIGSLKKGKLADFLILNSNPLEDIHNSRDLEYTVINGEVFESETMKQLWPAQQPAPHFYFQEKGSGYTAPGQLDSHGKLPGQCGCGMH